jgi:hypothetical protein
MALRLGSGRWAVRPSASPLCVRLELASRFGNARATSGFHLPLLPGLGPLETAPDSGFGIAGREQPLQLGDLAIRRGNGALARCELEVSARRPEAGGLGVDVDGALSGSAAVARECW